MRKVIVAIDSFKGCLTSTEANQAAAEGILSGCVEVEVAQIPVSDGGEGFLTAFQNALGGEVVEVAVRDPLMRRIMAKYLINSETAVIEMAQASGLTLLSPEERNPMIASTYGTGQLVADAVRSGCKHIIVGLGGSATSDCGIGMLRAIIDSFAKGGSWDDVHELDNIHFTIATDVTNPLCGEKGAAHVFAPQKFAIRRMQSALDSTAEHEQTQPLVNVTIPEMVIELDARAKRFAEISAKHFGYDRQNEPGAGAAGGLGYAFMQYMGADCCSGIDLLLKAVGFDQMLKDASLVITGEGSADRQTLMGKLPYGILQRAKAQHVPVALIAGRIKDRQELLDAGFSQVMCINPFGIPIEEAMKQETAKLNISQTVSSLF